jgi:hypothetical protein
MPFIYLDVIDDERIFVPISEIQLVKRVKPKRGKRDIKVTHCQVWLKSVSNAISVNETFEDLTARMEYAYTQL